MKRLISLNRVELVGRVGQVKKNEVKDLVCLRISVCTTFAYKNKEGQQVTEVQWTYVTGFLPKDEAQLDAIEKGSIVRISGRLRNILYTTSDGTERVVTEVLASQIESLGDGPMENETK